MAAALTVFGLSWTDIIGQASVLLLGKKRKYMENRQRKFFSIPDEPLGKEGNELH